MRLCGAVFLFVAFTPHWVFAQPASGQDASENDESDQEARRLYQLGSDAFEAERFAEAVVYFQQAYDLTELPDLLFNVGASQQRAGQDEQAIATFERYLELNADGSHRGEVETRLEVLRLRVSASAEGQEGAPEPQPEEPQPGPLFDAPPSPNRLAPILTFAAGGAVMASGALFLVLGGSAAGRVEDASGFYSAVASDADQAKTFGIVGGIALGVGAALVGVGVVLWVTGDKDEADGHGELRVGPGGVEWRTSW